ncbi:MAG TPA: hypothetical protein VHU80_01490 [Polyangiaceae bacterium]|nr:hypothetical protein [Polyangiaceae bacterium]
MGFLSMACSAPSEDRTTVGTVDEAVTEASPNVTVGPRSIAYDFAEVTYLPAGVAAGRDVVFIGDPLESRVIAYSRYTGKELGELPQPPGGFVIPFIMHSTGENQVTVLGAGGLPEPKPFVPAHPFLYEYRYDLKPHTGFTASLTRFVDSTGTLVGFPEDFTRLDDGRILLTDAVLGSIWIIERDGTYRPGIVPKTFDAADAIPALAICPTMPEVTVNGVPFLFSGSTIPGVEAIAVRHGTVYFSSSCARGVYSFPLAILDDHRQPYQRARDIRLVSPTPAGTQVEELLDFQFNPFDQDDPNLYAARGMQLEITRIDTRNGHREVIAHDSRLLDFPSSLAFLPPVLGFESERANLVVVSNQQERTPITNDAVTEDAFNLPFIVTKVLVTH